MLAASISRTSIWFESVIALQFSHKSVLQIFSNPFEQLSDLATILANVVLPTPLMPVKRYALGILLVLIELIIVSQIMFCPIKSSNTCGLYFKAKIFEFFFMFIGD